jgi:phosphoribosylformimino-5-aminoimidazole carboxamide ribotide isomerase
MMDATRFTILPAIDLRGGRVVRLRQGDFSRETAYDADPTTVARGFADAGARWLHVVDLDAARTGVAMEGLNGAAIKAILAAVGDDVSVELAGGLRTDDAVDAAFAAGAARVVVGTAALQDPSWVGGLVTARGPDRVCVALDVRDGQAVGQGWVAGAAAVDVADALRRLADEGARTFEVTAIERDGLLKGPDLRLYERLAGLVPRTEVIASGGIAGLDDLRAVRGAGCAGAIVGRALYEGQIDLRDAISLGIP